MLTLITSTTKTTPNFCQSNLTQAHRVIRPKSTCTQTPACGVTNLSNKHVLPWKRSRRRSSWEQCSVAMFYRILESHPESYASSFKLKWYCDYKCRSHPSLVTYPTSLWPTFQKAAYELSCNIKVLVTEVREIIVLFGINQCDIIRLKIWALIAQVPIECSAASACAIVRLAEDNSTTKPDTLVCDVSKAVSNSDFLLRIFRTL